MAQSHRLPRSDNRLPLILDRAARLVKLRDGHDRPFAELAAPRA